MSIQRCKRLAVKLDAVILAGDGVLTLVAPAGYAHDGDHHERMYYYDAGDKGGAWLDMWRDLMYYNQFGFDLCPSKSAGEDCDWCDDRSEIILGHELIAGRP